MNNKYSVLMSVYRKENPKYFVQALDSMINQTIKPDEIVLVEDGELTPELYNVIDEYNEKYSIFNVLKNEKNIGLGLSLNKGLKACKNELVARMDTDDISKLDRCEKQLKIFNENNDISIIGSNISEFIDNKDNIVGRRIVPQKNDDIYRYIKKRCPFNHMSVMLKKSDIIEVGNYRDWFWNEDYYLWIRMALKNKKFANLEEVLVYVRVGNDMYKRRGGLKYFFSEYKLQKYMLEKKMITFYRFFINVWLRFILQVLMPNSIRELVFKKIIRI